MRYEVIIAQSDFNTGVNQTVFPSRTISCILLSTILFIPFPGFDLSLHYRILQTHGEEFGIPLWNQTFGGPDNDWPQDIIEVQNGGFAVTGIMNNPNAYPVGNAFLLRTDSSGVQLWNQTYNSTIVGREIIEARSGGYAIVGYGGWLIRTDEVGLILWNTTYQDENNELQVTSLVENYAGGFAIAGYQPGQGFDVSLVITDKDGRLLWRKVYSGPSDLDDGGWGHDIGYDIIEHSTGGYVIAGTLDDKLAMIRVDVLGNLMWRRSYNRLLSGDGYSLTETKDGGIILTGVLDHSVKVIRTNSAGDVLWETSYGSVESSAKIIQRNGGGFALCSTKNESAWIANIAENGTLLWERSYRYQNFPTSAYSIITFGLDDYVIAGSFDKGGMDIGGTEIWLLAISEFPSPQVPLPVAQLSFLGVGIILIVLSTTEFIHRRRIK